jgi:SIT family siderophore-iron:H+ symporter-like MFS transporter
MLDIAVSRAFGQHSLRATVSTITAVFQAVSQPPIAKFADVFGRVNAYLACVALYVIGYIIVPSSQNIYAYAAGNSIYILGITGLFLLQNIIISDISSLRSRYFWTIFPSIPGAINVFVAPIIVDSFLSRSLDLWRWGFAMCKYTPRCKDQLIQQSRS